MRASRFHARAANSLRKKFSTEEDNKLRQLVEQYGTKNWDEIARQLPDRSPRQCRDRYKYYLIENLVSEPWSPDEDSIVIRRFQEIGPRWVEIATYLTGRSGNHVKNRWHKHLSKLKDLDTLPPTRDLLPPPTAPRPAPEAAEKQMIHMCQATDFTDCDWQAIFAKIEASVCGW
jgi:hypothetical protein